MDVFSRLVVGWMVALRESATLASKLIDEACERQGISPGQLTVHSDRGPSMTSKTVALLLADLGVTKTHSRPYVSDDNPFSEAQFKTLKYRPGFPDRFGSLQDARAWCRPFFEWYNHHHRHSGIAFLTPAVVHAGGAEAVLRRRAATLGAAASAHPERFVGGPPRLPRLPEAVWINPPRDRVEAEEGGYQDMDRAIISRPGGCQGPSISADAPSLPLLPPNPPLLSLTPSSPKNRAMSVEDLH